MEVSRLHLKQFWPADGMFTSHSPMTSDKNKKTSKPRAFHTEQSTDKQERVSHFRCTALQQRPRSYWQNADAAHSMHTVFRFKATNAWQNPLCIVGHSRQSANMSIFVATIPAASYTFQCPLHADDHWFLSQQCTEIMPSVTYRAASQP